MSADRSANLKRNGAGRHTPPISTGERVGYGERVLILGGGIAGLTTALELLRRGRQATVVEKAATVGGLARTVQHGPFRFDVGGHRFHSDDERLLRWLHDLLGDDLLRVQRRSHIYLRRRFLPYPLRFPGSLAAFSAPEVARILLSYLAARARHRLGNRAPARSFEEWVVRRFGRALYEIYFRPYTEKVWGMPPTDLSAAWAAQRISVPGLWSAIRRTFVPGDAPPPTLVSKFWYPRAGFGAIARRLAEEIEALGGEILTEATVHRLQLAEGAYTLTYRRGDYGRRQGAHVVSTIPLDALLRALPGEDPPLAATRLDYRDLLSVFLAVDRPRVSADQWTYFPQPELIFGRTHEPPNWSPEMAPAGMTSLVAEIFTGRDEPLWQQPAEKTIAQTVAQLEGIGFLPPDSVVDARLLRVENAYPVYRVGYEKQLAQVHQYLARYPCLQLVGRTGSFRYLNSDGVMESAFALVEWLTGGAPTRRPLPEDYVVP